jgi:predicted nucleotidyltransferase
MSRQVDLAALTPIWQAQPNLIAVWLFGSAQSGEVQPGSDLDFGLLFAAPPSLDELTGLSMQLQRTLDFDQFDLVPLNTAHPYLRFEAISGRPLFCRDLDRRAEFASLAARDYEDEWAFWQKGLRYRAELSAP